jgi:hypothetical protein
MINHYHREWKQAGPRIEYDRRKITVAVVLCLCAFGAIGISMIGSSSTSPQTISQTAPSSDCFPIGSCDPWNGGAGVGGAGGHIVYW